MTEQPVRSAPRLDRRRFLQASGVGAAAIAAPAIVSPKALASSGEINIMMWSDYLPDSFRESFTNATGITINFTGIGSNEEIINRMRASRGQGFDIVSPTMNRAPLWAELDLLQPIDMSRVPTDKVNPNMLAQGSQIWNLNDKGPCWVPHIWGTEGIAWRTDLWQPEGEFPSYGAVWEDANAGKTMGRGHSMMLGAGLYLERIGQLEPGSMWLAYTNEDDLRRVWGQLTEFCISKKPNVRIIWNDADTQKNGLMNEGVVVGQTWDGPPLSLKTAGEPIMYRAPIEGAMAWVDGMTIPIGAQNMDAVYAFIEHCYNAEAAGRAIDTHGYNSPVIGAERYANEDYARNFADAYPGDALANLNPWPAELPWYADIRAEYVNRFLAA
ncbi:MAG: extracellular solute-binding protein [Geminicoccaceae bacterium]